MWCLSRYRKLLSIQIKMKFCSLVSASLENSLTDLILFFNIHNSPNKVLVERKIEKVS